VNHGETNFLYHGWKMLGATKQEPVLLEETVFYLSNIKKRKKENYNNEYNGAWESMRSDGKRCILQ